MEFQAVVMAAGCGSRMTELTNSLPKCLLPIGGVPMIYHPLKLLENAGFQDALVIIPDLEEGEITKALSGLTQMKLNYVTIPANEDWGTAESLNYIRNEIKSDILVVSCDLITDFPLTQLADIHRLHDSSFTMLLSSVPPSLLSASVPGRKGKEIPEKDYIGIDPDTGRVLILSSEADLEDVMSIRTALLKRYPLLKVFSSLMDMHLYIIKPWILDYLALNKHISTIKGELLPMLVKKQFHKKTVNQLAQPHEILATHQDVSVAQASIKRDLRDFMEYNAMSKLMQEMSSWSDHWGDFDDAYHGDKMRCFSYILKDKFCMRANTVASYSEANKLIPKVLLPWASKKVNDPSLIHPKAQISYDCVVVPGARIGEKANVKKSVIGKECVIKEKAKITNSILMDHVTIEEGCSIQGCIISKEAVIGSGVNLSDCLVGKGQKVLTPGNYSKEVIVAENHLMEIG